MCLAVPGKIISVASGDDPLFKAGQVSFEGIVREVNLAAVPEAQIGDYVLVHVGMALNVIDEAEALKTLEYLKEIDELNQEIGDGTTNSDQQ